MRWTTLSVRSRSTVITPFISIRLSNGASGGRWIGFSFPWSVRHSHVHTPQGAIADAWMSQWAYVSILSLD